MCGIAGFIGMEQTKDDAAQLIDRMCRVIGHRGPDDQGVWSSAHVALGMRRLAIINVSRGQQPIFNEDGSILVVFNGEIYNYRELQQKLRRRGHHFQIQSDTEVIVHAYEEFDLPTAGWSLRDSNLDADFPTAAGYGEQIYAQEGGAVPVQGVIAITPTFIRHVLDITGPIVVPEYHETVNSQNLVDRIHYYQLGPGRVGDDTPSPDGQSSVRKHFTELLAEDLLARVRQISSSSFPALLQLLMNSLHSKDIQLYLNSSIAEKLLQQYHLDAAIQSPNGDSFFVVDANIAGDKANAFITDTLNDQVIIDQDGNSTHHTTLSYAWKVNGDIYGSPLYRDYIRVYAPPRSTLLTQSGWQPHGSSNAFGHSVWAGFFTLTYGQTRTITLTWTTPGAAQKDVKGWHYHYLIQRQAGAQWTLHLQVTLPSCATITNKQGGFQTHDHSSTTLDQPLEEDLSAEIGYTCV